MYKLTTEKFLMIADYLANINTAEKMPKAAKRLMQMLDNGECSWEEYKRLLTYRRINEAKHGYGAEVIRLINL